MLVPNDKSKKKIEKKGVDLRWWVRLGFESQENKNYGAHEAKSTIQYRITSHFAYKRKGNACDAYQLIVEEKTRINNEQPKLSHNQ